MTMESADPLPRSNCTKENSRTSTGSTIDALMGPPRVMTKTMLKSLKLQIAPRSSRTAVTDCRLGSVIWKNF